MTQMREIASYFPFTIFPCPLSLHTFVYTCRWLLQCSHVTCTASYSVHVLASSPGSPSFRVWPCRSKVIRGIITRKEGEPGDEAMSLCSHTCTYMEIHVHSILAMYFVWSHVSYSVHIQCVSYSVHVSYNVHVQGVSYSVMSIIAGSVREMLGLHSYEMVEVNPTQHSDYLVF